MQQSESFWKVMSIVDIMRLIQEYADLRQLFAASKQLSETKQHVQYWNLTFTASVQYYEKEEFRRIIREKVMNVSKQLSLNFVEYNEYRTHTYNKISDVSALGNVHTLYLSWCQGITDVSALGNVHELHLSGCDNITDVSALGNVHTLYLSGCRNVTDVNALGNVHTLYLSGCRNVTNVSALGNVQSLYLSDWCNMYIH